MQFRALFFWGTSHFLDNMMRVAPSISFFIHSAFPETYSFARGEYSFKKIISSGPQQYRFLLPPSHFRNCFCYGPLISGIVSVSSLLFLGLFLFPSHHFRNVFCFRILVSAIVFVFDCTLPKCFPILGLFLQLFSFLPPCFRNVFCFWGAQRGLRANILY